MSMNYKFVECPKCGHSLQVLDNMSEITCNICNTEFYDDLNIIYFPFVENNEKIGDIINDSKKINKK